MANNKIKHKLQKFERKLLAKYNKLKQQGEEAKEEANKIKEELERRSKSYQEIVVYKHKIKLAIERSKQLDKEFRNKISEFKTKEEFDKAYKANKEKRNQVIFDMRSKLIDMKLNYSFEFETTSFKIKRWFFGMIKEFQRIYWLKRKQLFYSFLIVVSITLILSILFLILNIAFAGGI